MTITHAKVSAVPDGGDATKVQPSDWNNTHTIAAGYTLLKVKTKILNNNEIKNSPTTPVIIIPATETPDYAVPSQVPVIVCGIAYVNNYPLAYGNVDLDAFGSLYLSSELDVIWSTVFLNDTALTNGSFIAPILGGRFVSDPLVGLSASPEIYDNAIMFKINNNGAGVFTDGHANNTIKITLYYLVADL